MNNPQFVKVDNKLYKINTDFRVALECNNIAEDKTIGDYERALALNLAGDTSFVYQHSAEAYASRPDEGYEINKPTILDHSRVHEEYLYALMDGKWVTV